MLKKTLSSLLIAMLMISSLGIQVYATDVICNHGYNTFYDHKLTGGVGQYGNFRRYYWIDTSALDSTYQAYVQNGVSTWVNTSTATSISFRQTTTKADGSVEFSEGYLGSGILGQTLFYKYNNTVDYLSEDWGWCRIILSVSVLNSLSSSQRQGTAAHEFGHAMGLAHKNSIPSSIMCQYGSGRTATSPTSADCTTVNHIYG